MTAYINKIANKAGNQQLPVTHERAVRDDNGTTAETKFQNLEGAMDKAYVASSDNGMGRITLKKNMVSGVNTLTQSMMQATNTIYVIRYDFTLGEDITVPENCVLEFDGGSISAGSGENMNTIIGNNTGIKAKEDFIIFDGVNIEGTWLVTNIYAKWYKNVENENNIRQIINLSSSLIHNNIFIDDDLSCTVAQKTTWIEGYGLINLKSHTNLYLNGSIRLNPQSIDGYEIICLSFVEDIVICGSGSLIGDKENHIHPSGGFHQHGHGISIRSAKNILIKDITISEMVGDGFINNKVDVAQGQTDDNIVIDGITVFNCGRSGLNIGTSKNMTIQNFHIYNVSGYNNEMGFGIDVEEGVILPIENLYIRNGYIHDCVIGFQCYTEGRLIINAVVENVKIRSKNSYVVDIHSAKNIIFRDCVFDGSSYETCCIKVEDYSGTSSHKSSNVMMFNCVIRSRVETINTLFKNCIFGCENRGISQLKGHCTLEDCCLTYGFLILTGNGNSITNCIFYTPGTLDIPQVNVDNGATYQVIKENKCYNYRNFVQSSGQGLIIMDNIHCALDASNGKLAAISTKPILIKNNISTGGIDNGTGGDITDVVKDNEISNFTGIDTSTPSYISDLLYYAEN